MKRYVYAMSKSKSELGDFFESRTEVIIEHLIKLYLYPRSRDVEHWRREVANHSSQSFTLKGSHKLPSASFILKNTIQVHRRFIPNYIKCILEEYGSSRYSNDDTLVNRIEQYFNWMADQLSTNIKIPYSEIYAELEESGF